MDLLFVNFIIHLTQVQKVLLKVGLSLIALILALGSDVSISFEHLATLGFNSERTGCKGC